MSPVAGPRGLSRWDLLAVRLVLGLLVFPAEASRGLGDIRLTDAGRRLAVAPLDEGKALFRQHLLAYVPLAAHVRRVLDERASHTAPKSRFLDELEDHMSDAAAEQTLSAVVGWGRYAEAFAYDDRRQRFSLDNPA